MMHNKKVISAAVASFGLMGFVAATQADTVIDPSTTTYEYTGSPNVSLDASAAGQFYNVQGNVEAGRLTSFGNGALNDGLVGNQAYLDNGTVTRSNYQGNQTTPAAYVLEGSPGQTGTNGVMNTSSRGANEGVLFTNSNATIVFNLGQNYTNLSTVTIYGDWDSTTQWSTFKNVSITDGTHTALGTQVSGSFNNPPAPAAGNNNQGTYFANVVNISALSGQFITLTFTNAPSTYAPLNEIQFSTSGAAAVPEPASLGLLSIGGLALLRRRAKRRA